jgi:hypothetical protein
MHAAEYPAGPECLISPLQATPSPPPGPDPRPLPPQPIGAASPAKLYGQCPTSLGQLPIQPTRGHARLGCRWSTSESPRRSQRPSQWRPLSQPPLRHLAKAEANAAARHRPMTWGHRTNGTNRDFAGALASVQRSSCECHNPMGLGGRVSSQTVAHVFGAPGYLRWRLGRGEYWIVGH